MVIPKNTKDLKLTEISFAKTKQIAVELNKVSKVSVKFQWNE